jgi:hypothetical protein
MAYEIFLSEIKYYSYSENAILAFPTCNFGHRSDVNGHHKLQKLWFLKWIENNERGDPANRFSRLFSTVSCFDYMRVFYLDSKVNELSA